MIGRKWKLRKRIRDVVFSTSELWLNLFQNVVFANIYDFCFPCGKSHHNLLNSLCPGFLIWGVKAKHHCIAIPVLSPSSACPPPSSSCLLLDQSVSGPGPPACQLHFLTLSWQRCCVVGTVINCLTRKRKTLREVKWFVQSRIAMLVETELVSPWLQSQPHPNHWSTLPCQEDMILKVWKKSSGKSYSLFFWNHFSHNANGAYAVSLSTQFNLAIKFKLFLVTISAFWDPNNLGICTSVQTMKHLHLVFFCYFPFTKRLKMIKTTFFSWNLKKKFPFSSSFSFSFTNHNK